MARKAHRKVPRPKGSPSGQPGKRYRVKGHTRTPRGPDQGKRPVRVRGYSRRAARRR